MRDADREHSDSADVAKYHDWAASDPSADAQHGHASEDDHDHDDHRSRRWGWLRDLLPFGGGHSHTESPTDSALESSERGIQALRLSLGILLLTALAQAGVYLLSGSVALLADTIHNFSDALTAVPLWIAFSLGRRLPTRRFTYGYGRAEDIAGVVIVAMIGASALVAGYEAIQRLFSPQQPTNLPFVAAAAIARFIGNEAVAILRTRVGKEIGSAALVADGQHARADGLTSLAVLVGAVGVWLGFPLADPLVGLVITVAILAILRDAARTMWERLMDAVDPALVNRIERVAQRAKGVQAVHDVRVRWLGHKLQVELYLDVDEDLSTRASHDIIEDARHRIFHAIPQIGYINAHADPCGHSGVDPHAATSHHVRIFAPRTARK
jgi:cation diffusion facilitator family transporter